MPLEHSNDFEMPVPYGHIRGKIWRSTDYDLYSSNLIRILALHGWQDNCGTFDTLIPKLSDNYYIVAIDFPGHGFSSHLPAGCPYNDVIFVIEVERIIQTLGWKDKPFTIMGHSMGAAIGLFYACLYPKSVQRIVALDMIKPLTFPSAKLAEKTREGIDQFLQLEAKSTAFALPDAHNGDSNTNNTETLKNIPLYEHKQAVLKLIQAHSVFGAITEAGAEHLLKRGAKPAPSDPNKVYFTRDNRLKAMLFQRMDNDALIHYFHQLNCELLIIKAENGVKLDPEDVSNRYLKLYTEQCPRFEFVKVPGGHHVHLCQPDNVFQTVIDFIGGQSTFYQNGNST